MQAVVTQRAPQARMNSDVWVAAAVALILTLVTEVTNAQCAWDNTIGQPGFDGGGIRLAEYDGELIAAGSFTLAGGTTANKIARWDGSSWRSLDGGMDELVNLLTVYNSQLIAGGFFTTAGGVSAERIARWDGSAWHPLGDGLDDYVFSLSTVYDGELIVAGAFSTADGVVVDHIARWNGSSWRSLDTGMSGGAGDTWVAPTVVFEGDLIAGGNFSSAGGRDANNVARWDGASWQPMGSGMNGTVRALGEYAGQLLAAGDFTHAGGREVNHTAWWDGTMWQPMGSGLGGNDPILVTDYIVYRGDLIVAGRFTTAGSEVVNHIARWDGMEWRALGSGMSHPVHSLTAFNGDLIAGGEFTIAGGVQVNHVARWDGSAWHPLEDGVSDGPYGFTSVGPTLALDNTLFVSGWFTIAGGAASNHIAAYRCDDPPPPDHIITGQVLLDGDGITGVTVSATGRDASTTATEGRYSLTVPNGWSGTVTPTLAGFTFTPSSRTYSNVTGDLTTQHFTGVAAPPELGSADPDSPISAAGNAGGRVSAAYMSTTDRPVLLDRDPTDGKWYVTSLDERGTITSTPAASVMWVDPKDGETYAGVAAENAFYVVVPDAPPATDRNLTAEIAGSTPISAQPTVFTSKTELVFVAGLDAVGDLVMYRQTGGLTMSGLPAWAYVNLSRDHLEAQGQATPAFQGGLVSYVTEWNGLNIAGLDGNGDVWGVWWSPGRSLWRADNLSAITGAPPMAGGLTAFVTPWKAINLAGVNEAGDVVVTWWVPGFGGDWAVSNLSTMFDGPAMQSGSLSSFVTPWGALNVAGIDEQGELTVYWWAPGLKSWVVSPLSALVDGGEPPAGRVTGMTTPTGQINLLGATDAGDVVRYYWQPRSTWQAENVSNIAVRR